MIKVWAILEDVGSEYTTISPVVLSSDLESLKSYIKRNNVTSPTIVYKELDGAFKSITHEGEEDADWQYWDGEKSKVVCKNIKTGEIIDEIPDWDDDVWDDPDNPIEEVWEWNVYKDGQLVETYYDEF